MWRGRDFPFLSQLLFTGNSNGSYYEQFNQTIILTADNTLNQTALDDYGIPYFTPTYMLSILTNNLAITATFTHMILYNWPVMKTALAMFSPYRLKRSLDPRNWNLRFYKATGERKEGEFDDPELDPHFRLMAAYKDVPNWWYAALLVISFIVGMVCIYEVQSTLPWWGFIVALLIGKPDPFASSTLLAFLCQP